MQICHLATHGLLSSFLLPSCQFTAYQGCQIFLGPIYQNGGKYTQLPQNRYNKWPQNISNGRQIDQMAIKYFQWPSNRPNGHKIFPMAVK
jgi:hypothetical protein